jgi:hypothetical protein
MIAKMLKSLLLVSVVAGFAAGCASTYTGVHKNEDGSYYVTKTTQGFLRVAGSLHHCIFQGAALVCTEIDSP